MLSLVGVYLLIVVHKGELSLIFVIVGWCIPLIVVHEDQFSLISVIVGWCIPFYIFFSHVRNSVKGGTPMVVVETV